MNKKLLAILALIAVCQIGYGQKSVNQIYKEFSTQSEAKKVEVGKMMMKLASVFENTMGVEGIEVLSFNECSSDIKNNFAEAVKSVKDSAFETMINSNQDGQRTKVLIRIEKDVINELVVLTSGIDAALIRIKGNIKKSDIEKVMNKHGH